VAGKPAGVAYRFGPEATAFRAKLQQMGIELTDFKTINRLIAENVMGEAKGRAPVDDGTLRGDIRGGASKTRAYVSVGRKKIPYAGPIHFGWPARNIEAQPFLYEAMDARADEVQKVYAKRVDELAMRTRVHASIQGAR
jgi:hypothetical protein